MTRHTTQAGIDLIKKWEGFVSHVYICAAGYPTIGFGHVVKAGESFPNGISALEAENLLKRDVLAAECAVIRNISVPLADEQFDALVSWTFNLGGGALQRSAMRRKLNRGDYASIPAEMLRWSMAGGKRLKGLVRRRQEEGSLFAEGTLLLTSEEPKEKQGSFLVQQEDKGLKNG